MNRYELELPVAELDLPLCVSSGQVFRWERLPSGAWLGVDGDAWYRVETGVCAHDRAVRPKVERPLDALRVCVESNRPPDRFRSLFRLEASLPEVERAILDRGPELATFVRALPGLRVLRPSDPSEVLFSFLCTPNNNLERITRMVAALAEYGEPIAELHGRVAHRFPDAARIAAIPESELRAKGFGYRGRSIPNVARQLLRMPEDWLAGLSKLPYVEAHSKLCGLDGVGPKLADCVCLFGLGFLEAAPVDTHLWQAACRLYFPHLRGKSLTESRYREVGGFLRARFGPLTGWAHQYLFYDNLLRTRRRPQ